MTLDSNPILRRVREVIPKHIALAGPWTDRLEALANYAVGLARVLINTKPDIVFVNDPNWGGSKDYVLKAIYGCHRRGARSLLLNIGCHEAWASWARGAKVRNASTVMESLNDVLLHEFAHEYGQDHRSADYYRALSQLGAKLTQLALAEPQPFINFLTGTIEQKQQAQRRSR